MIIPKYAIVWVVIMNIVFLAIQISLDKPFTLEGIIIIFLTIAIPLSAIIWNYTKKRGYQKQSFTMQYQKEVFYENRNLVTLDKLTIPLGKSNIHLRIFPQNTQVIGEMHLRLVDCKKWDEVNYPNRKDMNITSFKGEGLLGTSTLIPRTDHTNGVRGIIEPACTRTRKHALILTATIIANIIWSGYLVFRTNDIYGDPYDIYLPLKVEDGGGN